MSLNGGAEYVTGRRHVFWKRESDSVWRFSRSDIPIKSKNQQRPVEAVMEARVNFSGFPLMVLYDAVLAILQFLVLVLTEANTF